MADIETDLTNVFGIELDSEFGDCPVLFEGFTCPLLFAAKCREWAQASYAKQVYLPLPCLVPMSCSMLIPLLSCSSPKYILLFSKAARTLLAVAMSKGCKAVEFTVESRATR